MNNITRELAAKVLEVVDAGLVLGLGEPVPGEMCVEAAVCYALGLPHGDDPACVSRAVRSLKISLNDRAWSSAGARAKGMRRLAIAQLGSAGTIDDTEFAKRVAEMTVRKMVPIAMKAAASVQTNAEHRDALIAAANLCEAVDKGGASAARGAACAAAADASSASAARACAAAYAAASASASAAASASSSSYAAAATVACTYAVATAAHVASAADACDGTLSDFAECVVQILIEMRAPGCEWLDLTERVT
jgi:hypothetical protein